MIEYIVLGAIQGIAEWLPISSEGMIVLVKTNFFGGGALHDTIKLALFLHLGTFLAALVYFWEDVARLTKSLCGYAHAPIADKALIRFLFIATLVSGVLGFGLLQLVIISEDLIMHTTSALTVVVGVFLLGTGLLQLRVQTQGTKGAESANTTDGLLLGLSQGLAVLPGFSRSGLTVAALLMRNFKDTDALRMSFLMSLPIVLAGNIALNLNAFSFSAPLLAGLLASFIVGYASISVFLRIARVVQFGYFVLGFGVLMIIAGLV